MPLLVISSNLCVSKLVRASSPEEKIVRFLTCVSGNQHTSGTVVKISCNAITTHISQDLLLRVKTKSVCMCFSIYIKVHADIKP